MRILEVTQQVNEFNIFNKQGRAERKAEKKGKADMTASVDNLAKEFATYQGSQGKTIKKAQTQDVIGFLGTKNVDTSDIEPNTPMDPKRLKKIFTVKVQKKMRGDSVTPPQAKPASAPTATPAKKTSSYVATKDAALGLSSKEKRRLIAQLEKSIKSRS